MKPSALPSGRQEGRKALVPPADVTSVGSPPVTGTRPTAVRVRYTLRATRPSASGVTASTSRPSRSSRSGGAPSSGTRQPTKCESEVSAAARRSASPVGDQSTRESHPNRSSAASVRVSPVAMSLVSSAAVRLLAKRR